MAFQHFGGDYKEFPGIPFLIEFLFSICLALFPLSCWIIKVPQVNFIACVAPQILFAPRLFLVKICINFAFFFSVFLVFWFAHLKFVVGFAASICVNFHNKQQTATIIALK